MTVPIVQFPVPFEQIPAEVKKLTDFINGIDAELEIASKMLGLVRQGCKHVNAKRGYNERDGSWMNPCPHCGASE